LDGLAIPGCDNSDGLSEQSREIVAAGLFGGEVMLTKPSYFLGVPALFGSVLPFRLIAGLKSGFKLSIPGNVAFYFCQNSTLIFFWLFYIPPQDRQFLNNCCKNSISRFK
jgi:hypothetical protein